MATGGGVLTRRALVAGAAAALALAPSGALARPKMPLKEPPPRVQPLGTWKVANRRLLIVRGGEPLDVELYFRSRVRAECPRLRWWGSGPNTLWPPPPVADTPCGEPIVAGVDTPVTITIDVPGDLPLGGYRFTCEMSDPETRRRSLFGFVVRVIDPPPV